MKKQFNWTTVGEELVPPAIRHEFLKKIRRAKWVKPEDGDHPFIPGENIKEIIAQLNMPFRRLKQLMSSSSKRWMIVSVSLRVLYMCPFAISSFRRSV